MKRNLSVWILLVEILAIVVIHSNKDQAEKIKEIFMKRNHSAFIKTTPIQPMEVSQLNIK
ncbi:MAG: hypothetical protein JNK20_04870 [Flavipsychrobacter sp.]|jgi:hypothetical protein|nr:hypothetical protein [Flavipsychrobacter sp.]